MMSLTPAAARKGLLYSYEMEPAYLAWRGRPGEMLSVFDNVTDLRECKNRTRANATTAIAALWFEFNESEPTHIELLTDPMKGSSQLVIDEKMLYTPILGDNNNPYFTYYPKGFRETYPEAFMKDIAGNLIEVTTNPIKEISNPVPAIDDPTLTDLSCQLIQDCVESLRNNPFVRSWVVGGEMAYPDYFGLSVGDFRPASLKHFQQFLYRKNWDLDRNLELILQNRSNPLQVAWYLYREKALADRAAIYMRAFLEKDSTRPVFYPTHGNPFSGDMRKKMGHPPTQLVGACDGIEMGHIMIDEDDENLNLLYLATSSSFGTPMIIPRLGNKTLDSMARGGGRSFTPFMLRRLVYECLGMGAWHIGPIHWRASFGDGEWFIKDTPAESECRKVFGEILEVSPVLEGMSRLQPKVGLFIADDTWLDEWNPRWTRFFQDAIGHHWQTTIVGDGLVSAELSRKMPVLISIDNRRISLATLERLAHYVEAGGRLLVWGEFAMEDDLSRSHSTSLPREILSSKRAIEIDSPPEPEMRTLINEFQTGNGAWQWPHEYQAAPFQEIEKAVLRVVDSAELRPIDILCSGDSSQINVYPLTDGTSLLAVLINRSKDPMEIEIGLAGARRTNDWKFYNLVTMEPLKEKKKNKTDVKIEALGTALVWIHPEVSAEESSNQAGLAAEAIRTWERLGADTSSCKPLTEVSVKSLESANLSSKSYCLARLVLSSYGLKTRVTLPSEGGLTIETEVFNAVGRPVSEAEVYARLVPGNFKYHRFQEAEPGHYRLRISEGELAAFYDPAQEAYVTLSGPARIVLTARLEGHSGGSLLSFRFRERPDEPRQ